MKTLRIGMLGYGSMGHTHRYAIEALPHFYRDLPFRATLAAVCTKSEQSAQQAIADGIEHAYTDEASVIEDPAIDIIDICTPNVLHYETLRRAIAAGKDILCEKPLCVTAEQAEEIAHLARERGCIAQVVFNNRFLPPIVRAKQLIDEGRLGRIVTFRVAYLHASCTDPNRPAGWKQNREICGGGVWFDLGSHAVDLIYHLCGPVAGICGRGQIAYPTRTGSDGQAWQTNADEAFYAIATLENGAVGTIEANKLALGANDDLTLEIYGDRGSLRFSLMEPNWLYFYDGSRPGGDWGGERGFCRIECVGRCPAPYYAVGGQKAPIGWLTGHVESYRQFLGHVASRTTPSPSFEEAAAVQRILCTAMESDSGLFFPCSKPNT